MKIADIPDKFPIPFASAAGSSYIRPIPEASQIGIEGGAASLTDGFPPLNFQPRGAGGIPPFGEDFNGLLNQITAWSQWQNAGATVTWDSAFCASVGGYPQGAVLASANVVGLFWVNQVDDNLTNPDANTAAGWVQMARVKLAANQTFYVSTVGSDATGFGTNVAPWATLQHAYDVLQSSYDLGGFKALIQLANGAYAGMDIAGPLLGAADGVLSLTIQGNTGSPAAVTLTSRVSMDLGSAATFQYIKTTGADTAFQASGYAQISCGPSMEIANTAGAQLYSSGGVISMRNSYTISGGGTSHMASLGGGGGAFYLAGTGQNITISTAVTFTQGFINLTELSTLHCAAVATYINPSNVTASKYIVALNSVIFSAGTTFPGNTGGSTATGGQVV